MKYCVVWSNYSGSLSPLREKKFFEDYFQAQWFAKEMKKRYNWVICTESKNLEE